MGSWPFDDDVEDVVEKVDVEEVERVCEDMGALAVWVDGERVIGVVVVGFADCIGGADRDGDDGGDADEVIWDRGEPSRGYILVVVWDGRGVL